MPIAGVLVGKGAVKKFLENEGNRRNGTLKNANTRSLAVRGPHLWFSCCSSCEMPFWRWDVTFHESLSEFRELLRALPGTLRELWEPLGSFEAFHLLLTSFF